VGIFRGALKTSAAEIETVRSIDRNLALLFWVIAAAGMAGYSLGASLWANTDRKRRELSVLRLLAFRGGREEVQRHEKTDGLPGREVGRQHAVDDLFEEQVHEHRAEPPEDRGEERVEARVEHDPPTQPYRLKNRVESPILILRYQRSSP